MNEHTATTTVDAGNMVSSLRLRCVQLGNTGIPVVFMSVSYVLFVAGASLNLYGATKKFCDGGDGTSLSVRQMLQNGMFL